MTNKYGIDYFLSEEDERSIPSPAELQKRYDDWHEAHVDPETDWPREPEVADVSPDDWKAAVAAARKFFSIRDGEDDSFVSPMQVVMFGETIPALLKGEAAAAAKMDELMDLHPDDEFAGTDEEPGIREHVWTFGFRRRDMAEVCSVFKQTAPGY